MINIEEIRNICLSKRGVTESLPFGDGVLVFKVGGKMFLLLSLERIPPIFSFKNTIEKNLTLREEYPEIKGAYHMNKTHWNSVEYESLDSQLVIQLIDESYRIVYNSLPKKTKLELIGH